MNRAARDALVIIFVLAGIGLAILAYFWFSGRVENRRLREVVVVFDDVTGLRVGDPVEVQGLPRGKVAGLELDGCRIRCRALVAREVAFTEDTRFAIRSVSYLGSDRYLMVTLGSGPAAQPDHVFTGTNEALDLEETLLRMDRLLTDMSPGELSEEIKEAVEELLSAAKGELAGLNQSVDRFGQAFETTVAGLDRLSGSVDSLTSLLKPGSTAERLMSTDSLYQEVRTTNRQIQDLLADIKQNPRRYVKVSLF